MTTKYYDGVIAAQRGQKPVAEMPPFDMERARAKGFRGRLLTRFLENPRWALALLRRFRPIAKLGPITVVTRNDDVREVLERQDVFQTPFGLEMAEMAGGSNFVLGLQDGSCYRKMKSAILTAFPPDEVETVVRPIAARHSRQIMLAARPGFDAVAELLAVVPVRICRDYFGMVIDDEREFADWTFALSSLFFADPFGSPVTRELAVVAADRMRKAIDRSICAARLAGPGANTPLARLVAIHDRSPEQLSEADIRSVMMGMIAGFVPTNVLAAGNALDVVLSRRDAQGIIEEAIEAGDDDLLDRAILEAMRFKPINIGPSRYAARDAVVAEGTSRQKTIKAGTTVMAATLSAMFDPEAVRDPERFDPYRPAKDYLVFGHGIHWCIGSAIARVQVAEAFRVLFARPKLRRAGRLKRRGAFPESLKVGFDMPAGNRVTPQALVTAVVPVRAGVPLEALRTTLDGLGNPAGEELQQALDRAGIIHFASIVVACRADPCRERPDDHADLVVELSGDGGQAEVIAAFAAHAGELVRPVFEQAGALEPGQPLESLLSDRAVAVSPLSRQAAGLVFCGTPGHSVQRIRAESELEQVVSGVVRDVAKGPPLHAVARLGEIRRRLAGLGGYDWALEPAESLLEKGGGTNRDMALRLAKSPWIVGGALVVLLVGLWINYRYVFGGHEPGLLRNLLVLGASALMTVLGTAAILALAIGGLLLAVHRLERRDAAEAEALDLKRYGEVVKRENAGGAQNHLTAISTMKPGLLRHMALRFAFFVIGFAARHRFRPGHLDDIGTIHFARWLLLPGTGRLLFFSNYGGSWESYLEDFITKAAAGLTGIWSNTFGFPRARLLFGRGAKDGDRFKRWARTQQVPTLFWYSAYPKLNTARIRINSAIRTGLASAKTEDEARAFFDLFGSAPRPADMLEAEDIQGLFFGPFGKLEDGTFYALEIPDGLDRAARKDWLDFVLAKTTFGDRKPERSAMVVALGCGGLQKLGLSDPIGDDMLSSFPPAFRQGMASTARKRILDDTGNNDSGSWDWGGAGQAVDAVVICYAANPTILQNESEDFERRTREAGMNLAARVPLKVERKGKQALEPFGFADGISQPVVRGTPRSYQDADPQHRVEAGEFLFGYRDERGYRPPSPVVESGHDRLGILPAAPEANGWRDFGRNGTFLVVRQIEQHVEAFHAFCRRAAASIKAPAGAASVTPEWVGAKMVGRWQDGSSLVRNPHGGSEERYADNSFLFGPEDPQGTKCPFGSHVRRSNPRDSLGIDRKEQIELSKRHRILRVGRPYAAPDGKRGMMFMCLNADIERQFEFLQQTWISAGLFHGLSSEKDPLIGSRGCEGRHFTIPTPEGGVTLPDIPDFVTLRGGGYFFLPSRRALHFLSWRLSQPG